MKSKKKYIFRRDKTIKCMEKKKKPLLGIIRIDYEYEASIGEIDHFKSFNYSVVYYKVKGLTFKMVQSGKIPKNIKDRFKKGIIFLDKKKKVNAITSDCGFMICLQKFALNYTNKPVFLSSLCFLPLIRSVYNPLKKIAIFTANKTNLTKMENILSKLYNISFNKDNIIIVDCKDIKGFESIIEGKKVNTQIVRKGIVSKAKKILKNNKDIVCILMECTELPVYSLSVRNAVCVPVLDIIRCCDFFISGFR